MTIAASRPALSHEAVSAFVERHYGLAGSLQPLPSERDQNLRLDAGPAGTFVVKIASRQESVDVLEFQHTVLVRLSRLWSEGQTPRPVESSAGDRVCTIHHTDGYEYRLRVLTYLEGRPLSSIVTKSGPLLDGLGYALGDLDRCLADVRHAAMRRELRWDLRRGDWIVAHTHRIPGARRRGILERLLLQHRARIAPLDPELPVSVIHNDANDENVLLTPNPDGGWRLAGLLDFGDMLWSHTVNELAIAGAYAIFGAGDPLAAASALVAGYHRARPLSDAELRAVFPLIGLRLCVSVTMSAIAADEDPENAHAQISDRHAWETIDRLDDIDWRHAETRFRDACGLAPSVDADAGRSALAFGALLRERQTRLAPSLGLSYERPLEMVRGRGQFLFERGGRAYLDCVNNVCHVGHCHPTVVEALSRQAAMLNTNTRYLHQSLVEYAARLCDTLPDPLQVCIFVNSGSEANELAVRMARAHTGRRDAIVLEGAYHGNTATLVDLSPYKCEGPGGEGLPDWVHEVVQPDPYRGPHRGAGAVVGREYAQYVRAACERLVDAGRPPGLFLCESILGCAGQIVLPEGYLREAFRHVRSAGGVCVVDEIQVGFGRVGTHMWAFQTQGVVPDIVTLGKPMGNGHPIGAVVTTPEIANAFANGMEFFSSFGGNPVSCAVGMAVLDVVEAEGLRPHAARLGASLTDGLRALARRHTLIGDVRGLGLFIGVELVRDRGTLAPATEETGRLIELARADGVLLAAEGPHHNVVKIKPPLQFGERDAVLLLGILDRALHAIARS